MGWGRSVDGQGGTRKGGAGGHGGVYAYSLSNTVLILILIWLLPEFNFYSVYSAFILPPSPRPPSHPFILRDPVACCWLCCGKGG